jgi:isocitrate/isopropylmalate dehydrogenase
MITIVKMPGDGIGKVVLDEAIRVLESAGFEADYVEGDIGWEFWCSEGNPLQIQQTPVHEWLHPEQLSRFHHPAF